MKCSVIVPVYNAEKYLRRCADSILNQTLEDLELIMINDSSPDGSLAIMEEYAARYPKRVKIRTVPNHRQGAARNAGIELAAGEFLGFVDSDDWIAPDMYEKLITAAENAHADVAVCDFTHFYEEKQQSVTVGAYENNRFGVGSCCNKVFRATAVNDIRFPADLWYEDFYFSARVMLCGASVVNVNEPLYTYRIGHESTMHNNRVDRNLDIIAILDQLKPYVCDPDVFDSLVLNHVLIDAVNRVTEASSEQKQEVVKQLCGYVRKCIPDLQQCRAFQNESRNRRIIMSLNYKGQSNISRAMLKLKSRL